VSALRFILDTRFELAHLLIAADPWADQYPRDTWDLRHLGLADSTARYLRFGGIPQPWLRELIKRWSRWRLTKGLTAGTTATNVQACGSFACHLAPGAAPADLTRASIESWLAFLQTARPGHSGRRTWIHSLGVFLTDVRRHGWQPDLPANALVYDDAPLSPPSAPRWIPEYLMRQMEATASLALFPTGEGRLLLRLLISCGLRLKDGRQLPLDCVTRDDSGAPYLAWVNHKMRGRIAFFPISAGLADEITAQQQDVRARYPAGCRFLFPARVANLDGSKALSDTWWRSEMDAWLERIHLADEHGQAARVTAHQFRHTLGTRLKMGGVASDASFPGRRDGGAVRA
jgi:integrase